MSVMSEMPKFKVKKGDTVVVLSGKDKGRRGKVLQMLAPDGAVVVEKVNLVKKHLRPSRNAKGGIVDKEKALPIAKIMVVCPQCDKPARMGYRLLDDQKKLRYCKKCGEIIDKG